MLPLRIGRRPAGAHRGASPSLACAAKIGAALFMLALKLRMWPCAAGGNRLHKSAVDTPQTSGTGLAKLRHTEEALWPKAQFACREPRQASMERHMRPTRTAAPRTSWFVWLLTSLLVSLLTACASPIFDVGRSETVLPLSRAWMDGRVVVYVTTDISDLAMARMMGANHVPRLADAIATPPQRSLVERVYKFANEEQISIFQSAPSPVGAENQDSSYSPLWRVVMVHWAHPQAARELKSEEELLAAAERKELSLEVTRIVVNCPVTRAQNGLALKGVR